MRRKRRKKKDEGGSESEENLTFLANYEEFPTSYNVTDDTSDPKDSNSVNVRSILTTIDIVFLHLFFASLMSQHFV